MESLPGRGSVPWDGSPRSPARTGCRARCLFARHPGSQVASRALREEAIAAGGQVLLQPSLCPRLRGLRRAPSGLPAGAQALGTRTCPTEGSGWSRRKWAQCPGWYHRAQEPHCGHHSLHHPTATSFCCCLSPGSPSYLPAGCGHQHLPRAAACHWLLPAGWGGQQRELQPCALGPWPHPLTARSHRPQWPELLVHCPPPLC